MIRNHPHWNDDDWDAISDFAQPPIDELNQEDKELSKIGDGVLKDTRKDEDFLIGYEGLSLTINGKEKLFGDLANRISNNTTNIGKNKTTLGEHGQTLDGQTRRLDGHTGRLDGHDTYLGDHDNRLGGHDREIGHIKNNLIGGLLKTVGELGKRLAEFIGSITDQIAQLFKGQELLTQQMDAERQARELEINRQAFALAKDIDDVQYYGVGYLATDIVLSDGRFGKHVSVDWNHMPITMGFGKGVTGVGNGIRIDKKGFWRITTKVLFGGGQEESDWIQEAYILVTKPGANFSINGSGGYEGGFDSGNLSGGAMWRRPPRPRWGEKLNPQNSPYSFAREDQIVAMSFLRHFSSEIRGIGSGRYNMDITLTDSFCINIPAPGYTVYVIFRGSSIRAGAGSTVITLDMIDTSVLEKVKERIPEDG